MPSITGAQEPLTQEQARRARRYLWQMGLRVVCFVGAFMATGWLRWTMLAAAVVIPYVAVLLVNAGRDKVSYDTSAMPPAQPQALPARPTDSDRQSPGSPGSRTGAGDDDAGHRAGEHGAAGHRVIEHRDDPTPGAGRTSDDTGEHEEH
ncbi:DUF3099 domain-containing protein [Xylanimonas oleitrophica]|uniref:DUF3099 domain-containing protein n=1 Tax=Xylanimonas oleitrophica TaxID=2607479 RepID=A0A2W5WNF1_9MICO|nr:DUF3099 domain-containing protein [Xylanimonas oleitrophica]